MGTIRTSVSDPYDWRQRARVDDGALRVGSTLVTAQDFIKQTLPGMALRLDLVPGVSGFRKFGANLDIGTGTVPESIWTGGGLYPFPTATFTPQILSSSASDTSAGTGLRTVRLIGLDSNWNQITETITLNGLTAVVSANTWWRLDRMVGLTVGSDGFNAGTITARLGAGGTATIAEIIPTRGQTELGVLTIPGDRSGAITQWEISIRTGATGIDASAAIFTRDNDVNGVPACWRLRDVVGMRGAGSSTIDKVIGLPISVNPRTDIDVRVLSTTNNGLSVSTVFEVVTVLDSAIDTE